MNAHTYKTTDHYIFWREYARAALFSSTDDDGESLDRNYSSADIAEEAQHRMGCDCFQFLNDNANTIWECEKHGYSLAEVAHDFWLTRNGHGAGFWDGYWPEPAATILAVAAQAFGPCDLYVGDDGYIHIV